MINFHAIVNSIFNAKYMHPKHLLDAYFNVVLSEIPSPKNTKNALICINARKEFINYIKINTKYSYINFLLNSEDDFDDNDKHNIKIKCTETLYKLAASKASCVIIDSCLDQFTQPLILLENSLKISKYVICFINNYSSFRHRIHFLLTGNMHNYNIDKNNIINPFGINQFIKLCRSKHIKILASFYLATNGKIKNASNQLILPNLYLNNACFIISKDELELKL